MSMPGADRYDFEFPDEAGYPDGEGTLSQDQVVLIDDVLEKREGPAFDFGVVNNEEDGIYEAFVGDRSIGGISYTRKENRMALHATAVYPEFRHMGIATELIRRVLDDVRSHGRTLTIMCPIVVTFIENNPAYADLVDAEHPGVMRATRK
jgi:predicted GNAT family acetyltransferase